MNHSVDSSGEFGFGSGLLNPVKAVNAGLVYEASEEDYINLLCSIGYNKEKIGLVSGQKNITCSNRHQETSPKFHLIAPFAVEFKRRVKNVGQANSLSRDILMAITVIPEILSLSFGSLNEEKLFDVVVKGCCLSNKYNVFA